MRPTIYRSFVPDEELVEAHRSIIQDPFDPQVIKAAKENGVSEAMIDAAQNSPVYKFVKKWKLALPLHPEFRTVPMLFYVPPMLPVFAAVNNGNYDVDGAGSDGLAPMLSSLERARLPIRYISSLFSAGNDRIVSDVYRKLIAVRLYMRAKRAKDVPEAEVQEALAQSNTTIEEVEAIWRLTSLATFEERFVLPPLGREMAVEPVTTPFDHKPAAGFGFKRKGERRW